MTDTPTEPGTDAAESDDQVEDLADEIDRDTAVIDPTDRHAAARKIIDDETVDEKSSS